MPIGAPTSLAPASLNVCLPEGPWASAWRVRELGQGQAQGCRSDSRRVTGYFGLSLFHYHQSCWHPAGGWATG